MDFPEGWWVGNWIEPWQHDCRLAVLERAIAERKPPPGLVHHSDRGVQYASGAFVGLLRKHGLIPSMSRPANPYDNASCESFLKRQFPLAPEFHAPPLRGLYSGAGPFAD